MVGLRWSEALLRFGSAPRSRNVEIRKESAAGTQARRSSVTDVRPIYSAKADRAKEINTASANRYYKRVLEELVINERTRLKRELEIYEQRYWRREKAIISLEEKERLMRPIAKTREKLKITGVAGAIFWTNAKRLKTPQRPKYHAPPTPRDFISQRFLLKHRMMSRDVAHTIPEDGKLKYEACAI